MIFDRLIESRMTSGQAGTLMEPDRSIREALGIFPTLSGVSVTEHTAESIPAVYACVHVISETVGQLPLKVLKKLAGGNKEPDPTHPLYHLLHDEANPETTASEFLEQITGNTCLWGRGFAEIERRKSGTVKALWQLRSDCMTVDRDNQNRIRYTYRKPGVSDPQVWLWDPVATPILDLKVNGGKSPIRVLRETLGLTKALEQHGATLFGNGARPGGVLQSKDGTIKNPTKEQKDDVRAQWEELHRGVQNANRLAILPSGWNWQQVGMPPEDTQFLEARKFQVEEIARIYRVPLFMIQNTEKTTSWGTGIEQMALGFVNFTMMPWLNRWQQVIARDLLTFKSFETHEACFNVAGLIRGDIKSLVEALAVQRQNGIINANEWRELMDMNRQIGDTGDVYWRPANYVPADAPVDPVTPAAPAGAGAKA